MRGGSVTCRVLLVGEGSVLSFHIYQTANSADSQICSAWCLWAVKSNLKSLNHDLLVRKPSRDGLELCNDLSAIICWDRFPLLHVEGQVLLCFASFALKCSGEDFRGPVVLLINSSVHACVLRACFPPPRHFTHCVSLTHPPTDSLALAVHLSVAGSCGWAGLGCQWNIPEEKSPH